VRCLRKIIALHTDPAKLPKTRLCGSVGHRVAASRTTTDGTGRFLNTAFPSNGLDKPGTVVLDFNYAHNPPCGYTPYATYPLPTEANRIPVAIPAGEKRYDN